jgi:hypothetical protein
MHIATSVVNRILNVHQQIEMRAAPKPAPKAPEVVPSVPTPEATGPAIDQTLYKPPVPVDADPELAEAVALKGML